MSFTTKIKSKAFIIIFSIIILACIITVYKFNPKSMVIEEKFANPSVTFFAGDKQPIYSANNISDNITALDTAINNYNSEITNLNGKTITVNKVLPHSNIQNKLLNSISDVINNEGLNTPTNIINYKSSSKTGEITDGITYLKNAVSDIENLIQKDKIVEQKYDIPAVIKSVDNGMELSLNHDYTTNKYQIHANGGCLAAGAYDTNIRPCDKNDNTQNFNLNMIFNNIGYGANISESNLFALDKDSQNISYPFAMVQSDNNKNCITNNHGNISIQPCSSNKRQRWLPLIKANKCGTLQK